jgi:membrane-bound lytic murein transglycosylase D
MKTTLCKQLALFSLLVFFLIHTFATLSQTQNKLLLPYLVNDSAEAKTATDSNKTAAAIIPLQPGVRNQAKRYLAENGEILENIKDKQSVKCKTIKKILVKHGVPAELLYLAIVESELNNRATSSVGAVGLWQLMPATARSLGLLVNDKTDQRRHTNQSSAAAANYLKALYKQYDDWLLVVAAYNCGAGNLDKAIKRSGSRDFWKLQRFLPAETRNHVKHFIAAHFYYEENGSVVTLTKKERLHYLASLNATVAKNNEQIPAVSLASIN